MTRVLLAPLQSALALERMQGQRNRHRCCSRCRVDPSTRRQQQRQPHRPPSGRLQQRIPTPAQARCAHRRRHNRPCRHHRRDWCADRDDERRRCIHDPRRRSSRPSQAQRPPPAPHLPALQAQLRLAAHTPTGTRRQEQATRFRCLSARRPISGEATSLDSTVSRSSRRRRSRSNSNCSSNRRGRLRRPCRRTLVRT